LEKRIPGKLVARPAQHPASPALMAADAKVITLSVNNIVLARILK